MYYVYLSCGANPYIALQLYCPLWQATNNDMAKDRHHGNVLSGM